MAGLPKPVEMPSGKWCIKLMVHGRRISITEPTKKECIARAAAIKAELMEADNPARMTLTTAIDRYIESKDAVLSPSTIAGYRRIQKNAFQELMHQPISQLTQEKIQRAVNDMAKTKSPKSVSNAHGLLSAVLREYRPALRLNTRLPQKERHDIEIPSDEEIGKIMEAAKGDRDELPILLAMWLGLRMSEILGLQWQDIDGNVMRIRRARVDEGVKATKTYSSSRDLLIPPYILALMGERGAPEAYVVDRTRRSLYVRFQAICKTAGVSHYRFHDLRHINASVMLASGVPNKYAQQRLGHATDNMLKTVYQHTITTRTKEMTGVVDNYFDRLMKKEITPEITPEYEKSE